jgi:ribose transport system substrate-binding protein
MKKLITVIAIIILAFTFSSCSNNTSKSISLVENGQASKESNNNEKAAVEYRIGLVMKTLTNPFFVEMEKGARKAESEFGIKLTVKTGAKETSINQQIKIVEDMIKDKIDAIIIAPGSSTELIPVLKKAQDAKIPIINIDNRIDTKLSKEAGLVNVPFISVDNESAAYLSAKYISDKIKKPTEVVIIEGIRGADNGEQRKHGALRALKENKNIRIVAVETANWKIDEAYSVIKKIYSKYPAVGAIFCANDMMALGVVHYLQESGRKNVLSAGFDNLADAVAAIKTGKMMVTIDQKPDVQGYTGVKYAIQMIKGEKVPMDTMIKVDVIDASKVK